MPPASRLPRPAGRWPNDLILFDGVCLFCSRWVKAVMARDGGRFRFVSIQSPYGRSMAQDFGIAVEDADTNAVVMDGVAYFRSDAALRVLGALPGWGWTKALLVVPRRLRDAAYGLIARNRYALFGVADVCFAPTPGQRGRFLDDAPPP